MTPSSPRWASLCTGCGREAEVESRRSHGERVLCDACASKPYVLSAAGIETPTSGNGTKPSGDVAGDAPSTWHTIDLAAVVAGKETDAPPTILRRADGIGLIYPAKAHSLSSEPEAGKTWLMLAATGEQLAAGAHVMYVDFEDNAATIVGRLLKLGVPADAIVARFHYVRPDEPLDERGNQALEVVLAKRPTLAIIDGITEALAVHGLDIGSNNDVARWKVILPKKILRAGTALVELDHVTKDRETRGRYAIGAQHKLAAVDVAYTLEAVEPFGRGREGMSRLTVKKDRPGHVRQHSNETQHVAELRLTSLEDGSVTATLTAPGAADWRPTVLMGRISSAIEQTPGLSKRQIREAVTGKTKGIDKGIEVLVREGYLRVEPDGQAVRHYLIRPFTDTDRDPVTPPRPDRDPSHVESDRDPVTLPLQGARSRVTPQGTPRPPATVTPATDDEQRTYERALELVKDSAA